MLSIGFGHAQNYSFKKFQNIFFIVELNNFGSVWKIMISEEELPLIILIQSLRKN